MDIEITNSHIDQVAVINIDGEIIQVNRLWEENVNNPFALQTGNDYLKLLNELDELAAYNGITDVLNGKMTYFHTSYASSLSTEIKSFSMLVTPLLEDKIIIGATIILRDVSENENEQMEVYDVLESMTDAFISLDKNWKFTYINKEAEKLLFASKKELLGQDIWGRFPEAINTVFDENYTKTMKKREQTRFEAYYEPFDAWFEVNSYPKENGGISVYFNNINDKKVRERMLWDTAHHDYLTEIPNRLLLYKNLENKIADSIPFVIFFLDLNNFKLINDAYGHDIGDEFLVEVTNRLKDELTSKYFLSRFGGDKFILYTEYIDEFQVQSDAYQILAVIEKPFKNTALPPMNMSASLGVSIFPEDGNNVDSLITAADTAMYEAKKIKGDQWIRYNREMSKSLNRRLIIEKSIEQAVINKEIYPVFLPQVDILNNKIRGIEVLTRWNHPELGVIHPKEFIPVAEETGQIRMLTEYIIDTSLFIYTKWGKIYNFSEEVSFNISSTLLNEPSFVSFLLYQVNKHSISRDKIAIEITENSQIYSSSVILNHLHDIHEAGIRIVIDNFGTGYSNLAYIVNLPLSKVKIDKFFINSIGNNQKAEAILQSIIGLANNMKIDILVDGIKTKEQIEFLHVHKCTLVQGPFYDDPLTEEQFNYRLQQVDIQYSDRL
ncbi:EAL domain-containing protein [Psychrobacillus psychrodurans]|uniref:sensor domain-containing protein n=1 Tax=Psychrobacillus psychrodurans TaxID=126157 RepID=UPI001F4DAB3C|nr:EAL domain-containing protein [Psychrobacillus psychrodurans]MCK1997539.1 EAL domain-containing protein [Psychrobacillus psychrodurans]